MRYDFLLVMRFLLVNVVAFACLGAAYLQGWLDLARESDVTNMTLVIFAVFLVGLAMCGWRVLQTSQNINHLKDVIVSGADALAERTDMTDMFGGGRVGSYIESLRAVPESRREIVAEALRMKLYSRISNIRYIADSLVLLGLIGTVIGFIIALSGVDSNTVGDTSAIVPMVGQLVKGMSVALWTTLVGSILHVWLRLNYQILASGTVVLVSDLMEVGERYAT